ncbi:MAG: thioredoxin-disulfide reductase [Puniceicoccaceae bacterium]|nr:MAG: thioredoxin-disulfide reductase [Puniceicoccaceae bacterium]
MSESIEEVIIVGTGCAGLTAAIYTARANLRPLVLEGNLPGGQLTTTSEVENFPGFPEGIDGFTLMDQLRKQAARFGTRFEQASIKTAELSASPFTLSAGEKTYSCKALIIATGASPRLLGVPGEKELYGGKGVTTCATCDGAFYRDMDVVVVGGGDSACEEALFLTRFCSSVSLIHRRDELRASKIMADRALAHPKIKPVWNAVVTEIKGVEEGGVSAVVVRDTQSGESRSLPCKGVFIAIGHIPNTAPFQPALEVDENGYFVPEGRSQVGTRIPGVYVAGDCADHVYRQAITAAGMGCQAAMQAERWLAEH